MCGLTGFLNLNQLSASSVLIKEMTDQLTHRGPDDEGQWTEDNFALGHRRLSIIDLTSAGHQPMLSACKRYIIAYNGMLYNFQTLRSELETKGITFHSHSDTEVVLNALAHWGLKALNKFNGMFAFALWDRKEKILTLARDRYGIKPLYYTQNNDSFLFASEIKAFLKHPDFKSELDQEGLLEYFTFQNFFTDKTLHKNVSMLPAGHYLQINATKKTPKLTQYWDFNFEEPENPKSEKEYEEELTHLLHQAVSRQLVSDVEIGAYLSGGMDSGTITAIAAQQLPYIKSFTVGFDTSSASGLELAFDERAKAEHMSYLFKTEHYEMVLKSGDMERCLDQLVWHLEEPRVGQSYPNFYAAKLASKFDKVVLAGSGGDEIFGGYPWRYYRAVKNANFESYIDKYYHFWHRLIPNKIIHQVFAPIAQNVKNVWTRDIFRDTFKHHADKLTRPEDYINHSLYLESKTFLHGLLTVEDKLSMAHSLETRVPFLDNDLVDFAQKLPVRHKLGKLKEIKQLDENTLNKKKEYFQKTKDGKLLLRKAMSQFIPKEVTEREKQGFSAPDAAWFQGESIDFVKDTLLTPKAKIYDYLEVKSTQNLINEHLTGEKNRRLLIWSLLNVNTWLNNFIK